MNLSAGCLLLLTAVASLQLCNCYTYSTITRTLAPRLTASVKRFSRNRCSATDGRDRLFQSSSTKNELIGEDAAAFSLEQQSLKSWGIFSAAVATVLGFLFYVWIYDNGLHGGDYFKEIMEGLAGGDSTLTIVYMLGFFAICHSGLASLRPAAEEIVGARAWRVIFALVSLPLAFSSIVYFINHR